MASIERPGEPEHPGSYVREHVIPTGMSVTKAASLLEVGRPALSSFLNGRSALSQEMARKLERAFGADREYLLDLQMHFDRRDEAIEMPVVAGRHAPALVEIRAHRIEQWADWISAREDLPALLRRLICATGDRLTRLNFPAFDNSQRRGPDGEVETDVPTPWIPEGRSIWEFGCNRDPATKAKDDYADRVESLPAKERSEATFVFVTPRNWKAGESWATERAKLGDWKDVRAYDANYLEQWLEQSAETQIWFAERLGDRISGYRSLDMCWSEWAEESEYAFTPQLFSLADGTIEDFRQWLNSPPERPFTVAGDSPDEALAFACHHVREATSETGEPSAGALVFDMPEAIRRFRVSNAVPRIAIVRDGQVEREIGDLYKRCHCIVVRPGNDVEHNPDIRLGLPSWQDFSDALETMGLSADRIDRFARESGRSPTVLRRRLSKIQGVREPAWAGDAQNARKLLPTALVGAWRSSSPADREIVRNIARAEDDGDVESSVAELLDLPDSPLWATAAYRGVVSRLDALFGVAKFVTAPDLDGFFSVAERVLSEPDPALDLPEDERWAAALQHKVRGHSPALRKGIAETLLLLAVYEDALFGRRLGVDVQARVSSLVRNLLTPLTTDTLLSHLDNLPAYAEAAPDTFLEVIESDLRTAEPAAFDLLKPVERGPLGTGQQRSGLLWALEGLGWKHLGRVSQILAQLATIPIDDNWVNRPIASLEALYRSWLPRTSATLEERMQSLQTLTERSPDVGWQVCLAQLNAGPQLAFSSYRPRWRDDAAGAGNGVTKGEFDEFRRKSLDLVLSWPDPDHEKLGELVQILPDLPDDDKIRVWDLIDTWADAETDEKAKAALRHRIRQYAISRRSRRRGLSGEALDRAHSAYHRLEPSDPVVRHRWLFSGSWIELPADEEDDQEFDSEAYQKRIDRLRDAAMKEIWKKCGYQGVTALLADSGTPYVVGLCLEPHITEAQDRIDFLDQCLSFTGSLQAMADLCVRGFLQAIDDDTRATLLASIAEGDDSNRIARVYCLAPFHNQTWRLLDRHRKDVRDRYWKQVAPEWGRYSEAELSELVAKLLDAERPRATFFAARLDWPKVETSQLKRLLLEVGTSDTEPLDEYIPEAHDISDAFDELDGRSGVIMDEMVQLEFMYCRLLDHSRHGVPNLERRIAESPIDFVQLLAMIRGRDDGGQDPPDWKIENPEKRGELATSALRLLERIGLVPGMNSEGVVDAEVLQWWVSEARRLCRKYGRTRVGDNYIGQILSRLPGDNDDVRPSLAVCKVLEAIGSSDVRSGFAAGTHYGRGVVTRAVGEGGHQEYELATEYRSWAKQRAARFPFVASILEEISADYEQLARWEDDQVQIKQRLDD